MHTKCSRLNGGGNCIVLPLEFTSFVFMLRHFNCSGISDEPLSPEPIRNQENISPFACAILFGKSAIVPPTPPCSDRVMPVRVGFSWKSPMLDMAHISVAVRQSVGPVRLAPLSWFYFSWLLAASRISCVIPARYLVRQLCLAKEKEEFSGEKIRLATDECPRRPVPIFVLLFSKSGGHFWQ